MTTIFDDDFDKADHMGEIRKRPVPVPPPVEPPKTGPETPTTEDGLLLAALHLQHLLHSELMKQHKTDNPKKSGGNPVRDAARRVLDKFGRGET